MLPKRPVCSEVVNVMRRADENRVVLALFYQIQQPLLTLPRKNRGEHRPILTKPRSNPKFCMALPLLLPSFRLCVTT